MNTDRLISVLERGWRFSYCTGNRWDPIEDAFDLSIVYALEAETILSGNSAESEYLESFDCDIATYVSSADVKLRQALARVRSNRPRIAVFARKYVSTAFAIYIRKLDVDNDVLEVLERLARLLVAGNKLENEIILGGMTTVAARQVKDRAAELAERLDEIFTERERSHQTPII